MASGDPVVDKELKDALLQAVDEWICPRDRAERSIKQASGHRREPSMYIAGASGTALVDGADVKFQLEG